MIPRDKDTVLHLLSLVLLQYVINCILVVILESNSLFKISFSLLSSGSKTFPKRDKANGDVIAKATQANYYSFPSIFHNWLNHVLRYRIDGR